MVDRDTVSKRLTAALEALKEHDLYLLEIGVSERCLAARLGLYLQGVFPSHSVDVEYNRLGQQPKRLGLPDDCANHRDEQGRSLVYPDIIVHRRGPEGPNLLALEIKKSSNKDASDCDTKRIEAYRDKLEYAHAATIRLWVGAMRCGESEVTWDD